MKIVFLEIEGHSSVFRRGMLVRIFIVTLLALVFSQNAKAELKPRRDVLSFEDALVERLDLMTTLHVTGAMTTWERFFRPFRLEENQWKDGEYFLDHWNLGFEGVESLFLTGKIFTGRQGALVLVPQKGLVERL